MNSDEIHAKNFRSAIGHAQLGVYVGLLSSMVAFMVVIGGATPESINIPFMNVSVDGKGSAVGLLISVYFVNGVFLSHGINAAKRNIRSISDDSTRNALKEVPGVVLASGLYRIFLYCLLTGIAAIVVSGGYGVSTYWALPIGMALASPYAAGMESAKEIWHL
jgi:hypothetical protein